ncbi:MAG: transposase [Candidatus Omnitrophica bacterium]|nr:transposase [Candidatus Omnitrophota bacterium]
MGETKKCEIRFSFTEKIKAYFKGAEVTSNGGLLAVRELDEQMGLTGLAEEYLTDKRQRRNIQHEITELLRQSVYSRLAGYKDTNDAQTLRQDPALKVILGERAMGKGGSSENTIGRFEKEILTEQDNLVEMDELLMKWIEKADTARGVKEIVLDIDSSESPVYGNQEGGVYNGYFGLKLFVMAYNMGNFLRTLVLPKSIKHWSLRTIQLKMIKVGARMIKHARYYCLLLAETSISEKIFLCLMRNIRQLGFALG